jgi:succinoglycan biosynthesis transport protein ExoP
MSAREIPVPPPAGDDMDYGPEGEAHVRDYWHAVRNHLWLVLGITAIITTFVAIYMARKPDLYGARVRIQVDPDTNLALGALKGSPVTVNNYEESPSYLNTQIQILSSASLLGRVVKSLELEHNRDFLDPHEGQSSPWQKILRVVSLAPKNQGVEKPRIPERLMLTPTSRPATSADNLDEVNRLEPYVKSLQQLLEVQQVKDTGLIEIHFSHPDPQVAAKVANAIADIFVLSNLERKTETSTKTDDFLQKRIAELQSEIRTGEEKLINYAKNNQILSLDSSQNTVVERLAGLNRQLLEAENERKMAEAAYRVSQEPGAADALAASGTKDMESKLFDLRQKRALLLMENTEEWPEVKEVEKQIAVLEEQIQEAHSRLTSTESKLLETRYHQALAREQSLREAFNMQRAETLTQNEAAVNYRIIRQEIDTNKELWAGLLQRAKENDVAAAGTQNNIRVVEYAPTPKRPDGPRRLQVIVVAGLISLIFGVGLALFLEYLNDTIVMPDDVEKTLHLPALAVIPLVEGRLGRFFPRALQRNKVNGNGSSLALLTSSDARSNLGESYRQLRTLVLLAKAGRAPKTLLVTSSLPGEGKTTTAVNTAFSLAQTGARVLIIDADMRQPRMHSVFGLSNKRGLSTILSSELSEAEMLNMIQQHEESGLYLLACGPIPPNPAELLGSKQMRRLISSIESMFTHVVLDSPPVASVTDSVLLASMVDGVLLVVQSGKSSPEIPRRVSQVLLDVGAKIIGVVLNKAVLRPYDYYYYQCHYRQYYSKDDAGAGGNGRGLTIKAPE